MTNRFTKEQLEAWAEKLIEETHSDVAISRTDAHAESYRAQIELLQLALTALKDAPAHEATDWQVAEAVARMEGEGDMVMVPRGVLGAASGAIRHPRHESGVTLGLLRHYSFRKQAAPEHQASGQEVNFHQSSFVCRSDERLMEMPSSVKITGWRADGCCHKHPDTPLLKHPYMQLTVYPSRPATYCPKCEPHVAEWEERDKQLRQNQRG